MYSEFNIRFTPPTFKSMVMYFFHMLLSASLNSSRFTNLTFPSFKFNSLPSVHYMPGHISTYYVSLYCHDC